MFGLSFDLPCLESVSIDSNTAVDFAELEFSRKEVLLLWIELPLLQEIRIGRQETTSFCFLCMEEVEFHDLDSLKTLDIGDACLTYVKKLSLKS